MGLLRLSSWKMESKPRVDRTWRDPENKTATSRTPPRIERPELTFALPLLDGSLSIDSSHDSILTTGAYISLYSGH